MLHYQRLAWARRLKALHKNELNRKCVISSSTTQVKRIQSFPAGHCHLTSSTNVSHSEQCEVGLVRGWGRLAAGRSKTQSWKLSFVTFCTYTKPVFYSTSFLFDLFLVHEDRGGKFLRNVAKILLDHKASHTIFAAEVASDPTHREVRRCVLNSSSHAYSHMNTLLVVYPTVFASV